MANSKSGSPDRRGKEGDMDDHKEDRSPRRKRSTSGSRSRRRSQERMEPDNTGNVLYVGNLSRKIDENDLREVYEKYGKIEKIQVVKDPFTKECRGFAFVKYYNVEDATEALEGTDNKELQGRKMKVQKSKRGGAHEKTPGEYLGHYKSRNSRRSPSPYRRRGDRRNRSRSKRRSRDRYSRDRYSRDRRSRSYSRERRGGGGYRERDRYHSRSHDRYRDRSGSRSRRR